DRKQTLKLRPKGDSKAIAKGQDVLNAMFNAATIDPTRFETLKPAEQAEELMKALGISFDDLNHAEAEDREKRLEVGRELDKVKGAAASIVVEGAPEQKIDVKA